jgi:transposase
LRVGLSTVHRTRQRFVEEGLANALTERWRPGTRQKLDGKQEAFLVALACSTPPMGRKRWTMQLLADRLVALQLAEAVSDETVRLVLKKLGRQNPHSTEFRGKGCRHSAKASRREDLEIKHPVACGYSPAFHFHATLPGMLGSTLIRDQVVEVCQPREKRLLAAIGMVKPFHCEEFPLDGIVGLV